ncbi:coenzyme F420-reducing hydrogenase, beta subunit [Candidatus Methanoperedens nitroreducens]|uniref:Coenzyme F420-reducing hydrogenase, beta subunit n=1 Tax=Candidatus Methanoperedens nitratireducens TaxID=1392998 RepID=A0A062V2N4_9EURY|nr:Coenzyme F420 hydrogenase/dehydrogenase, beta subunit C-terminal domain [Candidatus Methanoperedens nitroreducens]KCZ73351.1 coenzyme F420-reducing hydrogenase, beta subunit [Candidatus Methanoperedens nitroreducens]MDJ1422700.1 Coenzyme F420 hydrogenase/dehydrogenase, beta subunit C-terminal domain [Candidatus Methanoperedens sp.]
MYSYEELESGVIQAGVCTGCGACISACPLYYIQLIDGMPRRPKKRAACKNCGTCFNSCYKVKGESYGDNTGRYLRAVSAKWDHGTQCQDGGIVTAILRYAYEMKLIDGAVLTCRDNNSWMPVPCVAKSADDFDASSKTKFGVSPVLMDLRPAVVEHGLNKLCVVGTPCHIQSLRHLQRSNADVSSAVALTIGLFCSGNLEYRHIAERIHTLGIRPEDVEKLAVSNGRFIIKAGDRSESIPLSEIKSWVPGHCSFCRDYTGELADISIGSEGSPEGWSTVIIRTEKGEEIFSGLEKSTAVSVSGIGSAELERLKRASEAKRNSQNSYVI